MYSEMDLRTDNPGPAMVFFASEGIGPAETNEHAISKFVGDTGSPAGRLPKPTRSLPKETVTRTVSPRSPEANHRQ